MDFPPINDATKSKSTTDLVANSSRDSSQERKTTAALLQRQQSKDEKDPIKTLVRKPLITPSLTKKTTSMLKRSSSTSSASSNEGGNGAGDPGARNKPITAKFKLDSLQSEIQITRADNSILRQDIQVPILPKISMLQ